MRAAAGPEAATTLTAMPKLLSSASLPFAAGATMALRIASLLAFSLALASGAHAQTTLIVVKSGNGLGSITSSPSGISCNSSCASASATFPTGTVVTLMWNTYVPTSFSIINKWTGGGCDGIAIPNHAHSLCVVTLASDTTVTATVTQYANTIVVLHAGTGNAQLTIDDVTNNLTTVCKPGTLTDFYQEIIFGLYCTRLSSSPFTANLSIAPDAQSSFLGWSGSSCSGTGPCSVNVAGHAFVTANVGSAVAPPPVFPLTVTSDITPTTANATANVQFRPQDVGTSGSVYVFALAPAVSVKAAVDGSAPVFVGASISETGAKDSGCVLAQLNSSGQLTAASSSQLQPYSSGVLSAQGQTLTLLNNASTAAVASTTLYVGYGATSSAMFTSGLYRSALTIPGGTVCPMVSSQTALWWNPAESGWGVNFDQQGSVLFGTLFDYDANRQPMWLVMSDGVMQADGVSFIGDLYRTTGPPFNANPFTPITSANLTQVGTMGVVFQDVNSGTLQYTVNGTTVTKGIQRQVFGSRAAACFPTSASRASSTNYQDLWWNPNESGWGINITHQDDTLFATLFTYDATGNGLWLVMSAGTRQPDGSYSGTLYRTTGPSFDSNPFIPIDSSDLTPVGTMRLAFTDGVTGTVDYTYNGVQVVKPITRQVFSSPVPACN